MNRRSFIVAGGAAAVVGEAAGAVSLREAARQMAIYALPLIEIATVRSRALGASAPANRFRHLRRLTTHVGQTVTQPNNDTLYSSAWLDLSAGPVTITLPATGERYISLALMDAYTNNFAVLGTRTTGDGGGVFVVAGPEGGAPDGAIRAPTPWVWALARILVEGEGDLAAVHALQDALRIEGAAGKVPSSYASRGSAWPQYFEAAQALILENPPPVTDGAIFQRTAALGVSPGGGFDPRRFSATEAKDIGTGLAQALEEAKNAGLSGEARGGWVYPRANLGDFRQDYVYRAQIALNGLAALPIDEATYLWPTGPDGRVQLDSTRTWLLQFPPGGMPPVDAFWSLTAYEVTPEGQAFLFENPLGRYAIGDRTPGLVQGSDGGLDIWIGPRDPGPLRRTNWLPAPTSGRPMQLNLRAYLPRPQLNSGTYRLPPLKSV